MARKREKYEPTWESLKQYEIPEWYVDAKFGIFIHWGPYCVPAFGNEWYPRRMYLKDDPAFEHHRKTWGDHTEFGYKDFIPMLTAENYDADEWAQLFKDAGAKFIMPVCRTSRRIPYVRQRFDRLERRQNGTETRCRRRIGRGSAGAGYGLRGIEPSRRALVVLRRRARLPVRCARPSQ